MRNHAGISQREILLPKSEADMVPNANARHFFLKAKQRDLIIAAGGTERAAELCSYSPSSVGRWANINVPEMMPLNAIFALEEETGRFDMSEAIAFSRGRRFEEIEVAPSASGSLMGHHAETIVRIAEMMGTAARAFEDGKITATEAQQIDRTLSAAEESMSDYRKDLARALSEGGMSVLGEAG